MNKKEKIDAIYRTMANKTPSLGCRARIYCTHDSTLAQRDFADASQYIDVVCTQQCNLKDKQELWLKEMKFNFLLHNQKGDIAFDPQITRRYDHRFLQLIGHPVMIGDVMDYIGEQNNNLYNIRTHKRQPIESQSNECIDYVHSLIQKNQIKLLFFSKKYETTRNPPQHSHS